MIMKLFILPGKGIEYISYLIENSFNKFICAIIEKEIQIKYYQKGKQNKSNLD